MRFHDVFPHNVLLHRPSAIDRPAVSAPCPTFFCRDAGGLGAHEELKFAHGRVLCPWKGRIANLYRLGAALISFGNFVFSFRNITPP
jgi:hypothetical protein